MSNKCVYVLYGWEVSVNAAFPLGFTSPIYSTWTYNDVYEAFLLYKIIYLVDLVALSTCIQSVYIWVYNYLIRLSYYNMHYQVFLQYHNHFRLYKFDKLCYTFAPLSART